jgi:hypothetical protein
VEVVVHQHQLLQLLWVHRYQLRLPHLVQEDPQRHHPVEVHRKHLLVEAHQKHLLAVVRPKDLICLLLQSYLLREEVPLKLLVAPQVPHLLVEDLQKPQHLLKDPQHRLLQVQDHLDLQVQQQHLQPQLHHRLVVV